MPIVIDDFIERDLYPKFLIRHPNQKSIFAAQGIQSIVEDTTSLKEQAIVTAPFKECSWPGFEKTPICWIPKETATFQSVPPTHLNFKMLSTSENPEYNSWEQMIRECKEQFTSQSLQKVVLSRKTSIQITHYSTIEALYFLLEKSIGFKNRASIAYMPNPHQLFFSMSPEKLFSANQHLVTCDLVAGTFSHQHSGVTAKEIAENDFVLLDLREQVVNLPLKSSLSPLKKVISGNLFHLRRTLEFTLENTPDYLRMASLLHPTAAICGYPRAESKRFIAGNEPYSRGYFAGYMGIVTSQTANLFVTIRSALFEQELIHLFAGCGIVSDSDPQKEWNELNLKTNPYMEMLFANSATDPLSCKARD